LPNAALGGPPFAVQQFQFAQSQEVARKVHAFGGTLLRDFIVLAKEGWQPQRFQMMVQQDLGRVHLNQLPG
jgi:hypothetical protein